MNVNPLHAYYCRTCTACGYTTCDIVVYRKHIADHVEHIAHVREASHFPKATDEQLRKWVSCFVGPTEIEHIVKCIHIK